MNTRSFLVRRRLLGLLGPLLVLMSVLAVAYAAERQMEARLVWGTDDDSCKDPKVKPLDGALAKKLKNLPLKFKNYFEVNRKVFTINDKDYTKVEMSKLCYVEVKDKGDSRVKIKLYGEGKLVSQMDNPLPKGETLALAGSAKDGGAWLVIVQPVEAKGK
jgi:hypothetical protein